MYAIIILWTATIVIAIAQSIQLATLLHTHNAQGISLFSEGVNVVASLGLLVYALFLTDKPLIASRCILALLWLLRLSIASILRRHSC